MDDRLGRSEYQIIHHYSPFIINEQESSRRSPQSAHEPNLIDFKCGRSIQIHPNHSIYLISLLSVTHQMHYYLV